MLNHPRTPSRSAYRSFRYSLNREQNVKTADPSSLPKFRIKKNSVLESTMMKTNGFEQYQMSKTLSATNDGQDTVYLRNFFSAMDSQKHKTIEQREEWRMKPLRFRIENFEQLETSEFTMLDPFQRHMRSIQTSTKNGQIQLRRQSMQIKMIRGQLQNMSRRITRQLKQIQGQTHNELNRFSNFLKQNTTKQQQRKMKYKQQISTLQIEHEQDMKEYQRQMNRVIQMQESIFNCRPYQLKENEEWKELGNTTIGTGEISLLGVKDGMGC